MYNFDKDYYTNINPILILLDTFYNANVFISCLYKKAVGLFHWFVMQVNVHY